MATRDYPRKKGDRTRVVFVKCSQCGVELEEYASRLGRSKNFFCNKECHRAWQETLTAASAARWNGGVTNRGPAAKARKARYRERNRLELRNKNAAYFKANPDKKSRYRKINRERWLPKAARWAHQRRAREVGAAGSYTDEEWNAVRKKFRDICPSCGRSCVPEVDHIVPLSRGGSNDISNLQPLCKSCNCRKHAKVIICFLPWRGSPMHENINTSSH